MSLYRKEVESGKELRPWRQTGVMHPQAREGWQPLGVGRDWEETFPQGLQRAWRKVGSLEVQPSEADVGCVGSRTARKVPFVVSSHPICGRLLWKPQTGKANTKRA